MAGRHRKPPAWRRLLNSLVRSQVRARRAALQAEVVALRVTVGRLRDEVARLEVARLVAEAAFAAAARPAEVGESPPITLRLPLVRLALADPDDVASGPDVAAALAAPDRSPDAVTTEIVLPDTPVPDRLAWSVLAALPENQLLDPRTDRGDAPVDVTDAAEAANTTPAETLRSA